MSFILDLIFPKRCYVCHRFGDYLCPECSSGLIPNAITNMPNSFFEGRLSLFPYKDCLQDLLYDLKYNFVTDLIPDMTSLVSFHLRKSFPHLLSYWQKDDFVLVPIPLHTYRQNWRGFNQSQLIAQSLADDLHLGCLPDLLLRRTHSPPQAQLKRSARLNNSPVFAPNPLHQPPSNIILFDDVYTTGSTVKSAATVLEPCHANVWILTLAG
ncbi:MAG: ComF family protein [Patescibacteria group bacterium]|jgi:competence protein ComFC